MDAPANAPEGVTVAVTPLLATALSYRGIPYRNGGSDPSGFDCSGFVQWVFAQQGRKLPREVRDQYQIGKEIDRDEVQPGDLVFFETVSRGASHVGIALGGDEFIHAPSSRGVVRIEKYSIAYWDSRWVGARRLE
jgi:cell wall-associated NlpC family hydrolase